MLARTWKVCEPSARSLKLRGLVHAAQAPASSLHSKVAPVAFELKLNDAVRAVIAAAGLVPIVVSAVATVHVRDAGVSSASLAELSALTRKVCVPAPRPVRALGLVQVAHEAPSSEHWKVAPG